MHNLAEKAMLHERNFIADALVLVDQHGVIDLNPADFVEPRYGEIWEYCQSVSEISLTEIDYRFNREGFVDSVVEQGVSQSAGMRKEAVAIRELAHKRRVVKALGLASSMIAEGKPINDAANYAISAFDDAPSGGDGEELKKYLTDAYHDIQRANEGESVNFIHTKITDFDNMFGGIQKAGLVIVAGRPSMGKTAFASAITRNISKTKPVLMISMEMSGKQLAMRFLAAEEGIDLQHMMQGKLLKDDWSKLSTAYHNLLKDGNIVINQKTSRTVADIAAEARRFKRKYNDVGLIVIDYLTLLEMPAGENQVIAVGKVSRALKVLSGELECPVMLLSQLNRSLENREDKRPMMSDLRDSGAIEQDADQIIFPFREEVYKKKPENEGVAEIIMRKNRNGKVGMVKVAWVEIAATFKNLAQERF
ncbi:MAG: DnaB helicase C-terminal domain-containing protein [Ghiorsea sp.]